MKHPQPWLRDPALRAVPVGWRKAAWTARAVAAEHGVTADLSVLWGQLTPRESPALMLVTRYDPSPPLPPERGAIQRRGMQHAAVCAARALANCMACGSDEAPAHVRLVSGGTVGVVAMLCSECELMAEVERFQFWPVIGRFDPMANEDTDDDRPHGWGRVDPPDDDPDWGELGGLFGLDDDL